MRPRPTTDADLSYWAGLAPRPVTFAPTAGATDPCPAIITTSPGEFERGEQVVRIPWELDEIDLAQLARGGTLWLSTWGGLPPHMLEVQAPCRAPRHPMDAARRRADVPDDRGPA